ncbi:MAG: TIGR02281 family clan AA aspartic protease [Gammaproteobacteria bacterium]
MSTQKTGTSMYVLATVGFIALLAWLFSAQIDQRRNPNQDVVTKQLEDGTRQVVLQRNSGGHYVASGRINDAPAEFIIDTGATDVAVSAEVAAALRRGPARPVMTANGQVMSYATRIDRLELGGIVERDVRASIVPDMKGIDVLLGMSFLQRLDFAQRGQQLVLERRATGAADRYR